MIATFDTVKKGDEVRCGSYSWIVVFKGEDTLKLTTPWGGPEIEKTKDEFNRRYTITNPNDRFRR